MVGYALAALYPQRITKWVVMDAPLPGIGHWDDQLKNPKTWHFNFRGPDVERLVAGRERILLDRFYNELSANPAHIDEQTRNHYAALYARPGAIHNAFSGQFAAFAQDAVDNQQLLAKGEAGDPRVGNRRRSFLWRQTGDRDRIRGDQCAFRRDRGFGSLDHGGTA
jgi:pimeloyl-ACP methyl ester carboxylesterase